MRNFSKKPSRVKNTKAVTPSINKDMEVDTYVEQDEINESPGRNQTLLEFTISKLKSQEREHSVKDRPAMQGKPKLISSDKNLDPWFKKIACREARSAHDDGFHIRRGVWYMDFF